MRTFLLSVFVYMSFNYVVYAFFWLICGNEDWDTWHEDFYAPLLLRIKRLIKFYIRAGFITIPVALVLLMDRFIDK